MKSYSRLKNIEKRLNEMSPLEYQIVFKDYIVGCTYSGPGYKEENGEVTRIIKCKYQGMAAKGCLQCSYYDPASARKA